jgi:hypothetical protein
MQGVAEHPASAAFSGLAAKEDVLQACLKGAARLLRAGPGVAPAPAGIRLSTGLQRTAARRSLSVTRVLRAGAWDRRLPCRRGGCARWRPATRLLVRALSLPGPQGGWLRPQH